MHLILVLRMNENRIHSPEINDGHSMAVLLGP